MRDIYNSGIIIIIMLNIYKPEVIVCDFLEAVPSEARAANSKPIKQ